jgi:superfamily I DNA/RNA helicase
MNLHTYTMPLDSEQMRVVEAPVDCHIRVLSTPGGGKSSVLVARVCNLIFTHQEDPSRIRIMSFSRQSAADVGARLPDGVCCSTIHSFCSELSTRLEPLFQNPVRCMFDTAASASGEDEASMELFSPDEFLYRLRDLLVDGKVTHAAAGGIRFLFVDEMQDLSPIQFEVIRLLSDLFRVRVFGVGDRNQNIYGFRNSDARFLDEMERLPHLPCLSFELTRNYRSLSPIVAFANGLVKNGKRMVSVRKEEVERKPTLTCLESRSRELSWLVDRIQDTLQRREPRYVAAIARTRKEVFLLSHKLTERGIPNVVIVNEGDSSKLTKNEKNVVSISTLHGSKGLEWPVVFLAGMTDTYNKSLLTAREQQQEDNLIFVAATRARDELHVTSPASTVSRVISRVPQDLFEATHVDKRAGVKTPFFTKGGQDPFIRIDRSVSNFVHFCSGELYQYMKQTGLLPRRFHGATIERLHAAHAFPEAFTDAKALYGSIVERVIFRQVDKQVRSAAVKAGGSMRLLDMRTPDSHANACFLFVRTDPITWDTRAATDDELPFKRRNWLPTSG